MYRPLRSCEKYPPCAAFGLAGTLANRVWYFGSAASRPAQIDEPRYLYFDRPFLIYVKRRQPNVQPFFVMWVDNAELLEPWSF